MLATKKVALFMGISILLVLVVCVSTIAKVSILEIENIAPYKYLCLPWEDLIINKEEINELIPLVLPPEEGWASESLKVGETRLLDLSKDGKRALLASIESGGNAGITMFMVFIKRDVEILLQRFSTCWG